MAIVQLIALMVFLHHRLVNGYSDRVPETVCSDMLPVHQGTIAQNSRLPYVFSTSASQQQLYENGVPITGKLLLHHNMFQTQHINTICMHECYV